MEGVVFAVIFFGACFAVAHFYSKFLLSGMATRTIVTNEGYSGVGVGV